MISILVLLLFETISWTMSFSFGILEAIPFCDIFYSSRILICSKDLHVAFFFLSVIHLRFLSHNLVLRVKIFNQFTFRFVPVSSRASNVAI